MLGDGSDGGDDIFILSSKRYVSKINLWEPFTRQLTREAKG